MRVRGWWVLNVAGRCSPVLGRGSVLEAAAADEFAQNREEVTVTLTMDVDIGFGGLGSFPIELTAQASGRSEVYWK